MKIKHIALSPLLLTLAFLSNSAFALCNATPLVTIQPTSPLSATMPANQIKPGDAIGGQWVGSHVQESVYAECTGPVGTRLGTWIYAANAPIPGLIYSAGGMDYPVYASGAPGIGFVLGAADTLWPYVPMTYPHAQILQDQELSNRYGFKFLVTYVVTGDLVSGTYNIPQRKIGDLALLQAGGGADFGSRIPINLGAVEFIVRASTCNVLTPNVPVALQTVHVSDFPSVGSPAGGRSFQIDLNCDSNINVFATMTDANDPSNRSNTLSLISSSAAAGVGVQILRNSGANIISFGPDSSAIGAVNQWQVGSTGAAGGGLTIPLSARYVRTSGVMLPGNVDARATITMSYQ